VKRLFIAVDLDEATRVEVSQIISVVSGLSRTRVTWVKSDRLHLTLEFFGEVVKSDIV